VWTFGSEELDLRRFVILLKIDLAVVDILPCFLGLSFALRLIEREKSEVSKLVTTQTVIKE
jgi:hypothetical protein